MESTGVHARRRGKIETFQRERNVVEENWSASSRRSCFIYPSTAFAADFILITVRGWCMEIRCNDEYGFINCLEIAGHYVDTFYLSFSVDDSTLLLSVNISYTESVYLTCFVRLSNDISRKSVSRDLHASFVLIVETFIAVRTFCF